jgi:hypothetical protein
MNEDFEQRLRMLLAASEEPPVSERFGDEVRVRIARLRRVRRLMLPAAAVAAGLAFAIFGAPLLAGIAAIAAAPVTLNGPLGALIASPVGYALGALIVIAAAADALSD